MNDCISNRQLNVSRKYRPTYFGNLNRKHAKKEINLYNLTWFRKPKFDNVFWANGKASKGFKKFQCLKFQRAGIEILGEIINNSYAPKRCYGIK